MLLTIKEKVRVLLHLFILCNHQALLTSSPVLLCLICSFGISISCSLMIVFLPQSNPLGYSPVWLFSKLKSWLCFITGLHLFLIHSDTLQLHLFHCRALVVCVSRVLQLPGRLAFGMRSQSHLSLCFLPFIFHIFSAWHGSPHDSTVLCWSVPIIIMFHLYH